jgi:hypothetical protein
MGDVLTAKLSCAAGHRGGVVQPSQLLPLRAGLILISACCARIFRFATSGRWRCATTPSLTRAPVKRGRVRHDRGAGLVQPFSIRPLFATVGRGRARLCERGPTASKRNVSRLRGRPSADTHCAPAVGPRGEAPLDRDLQMRGAGVVQPIFLSSHFFLSSHSRRSAAERGRCATVFVSSTSPTTCAQLYSLHPTPRHQLALWRPGPAKHLKNKHFPKSATWRPCQPEVALLAITAHVRLQFLQRHLCDAAADGDRGGRGG